MAVLDPLEEIVQQIIHSKKYRSLGLSTETVRDVLTQQLAIHHNQAAAVKATRQALHNIVAPYLGDPDYDAATQTLDLAFSTGQEGSIKAACQEILSAHISTRERLPHADEFYKKIFAVTGMPETVLDLACGLNPLYFPWMDLPHSTLYHAYDIHKPRLEMIAHFFALQGMVPHTHHQDILVHLPAEKGQVAFLFKEAHRIEQRRRGANAPLWDALQVDWLAVSLPAFSLSGRHDLAERQRALVKAILGLRPWPVTEVQVGDELVFCIQKG